MTAIRGTLFDAETLRPCNVTLEVEAEHLRVRCDDREWSVPLEDVRVSDRLASTPRFLYLPGQLTVETSDNDAVNTILARDRHGRLAAAIHWLEQRSGIAALATMLVIAAVASALFFGLPVAARRAAAAVPPAIETEIGRSALVAVRNLSHVSGLQTHERLRVQRQLDRILDVRPQRRRVTLEFRSFGTLPNAFALPGGIVVVSDELVRLATLNDELAAVLAHELGHLEHRHGLQSIFRNSAALLLVTAVTGDLSTLTGFAGTLPFLLLRNGYSRELEREADAYAVAALRDAKIDVEHLATILTKLEEIHLGQNQNFTYLSTHPGTEQRVDDIRAQR